MSKQKKERVPEQVRELKKEVKKVLENAKSNKVEFVVQTEKLRNMETRSNV